MCQSPTSAGPKQSAAQGIFLIACSNASSIVSPPARFHLSSHGRRPTAFSCFAILSTAALSFELWLRNTSNFPSASFALMTKAAVMRCRPALASVPICAATDAGCRWRCQQVNERSLLLADGTKQVLLSCIQPGLHDAVLKRIPASRIRTVISVALGHALWTAPDL